MEHNGFSERRVGEHGGALNLRASASAEASASDEQSGEHPLSAREIPVDAGAPGLAPPLADVAPQMLDPRSVMVNRIVGSIAGIVFAGLYLAAVAILFLTAKWPLWGRTLVALTWLPAAAGWAWLALKWPVIEYRHWRYRVDARGIEIWSGVLFRESVVVPRSRVQHIDVSQGPLERSYGLATLSIYTAGTQYSKVELPGLGHPVALAIRDTLLPKDAEPAV